MGGILRGRRDISPEFMTEIVRFDRRERKRIAVLEVVVYGGLIMLAVFLLVASS